MKCDKCGFNINPGDQVCMNCGAKLSLYVEPENSSLKNDKKSKYKYLALIIGGILLIVFFVVILVIFLIIR